jgi:signal transduction histidine kinase/DNA-binding response OmpR family regulator
MESPQVERAPERFTPEVDLLRRFLLWGEGAVVLLAAIFVVSFTLTRSPMSLGLAVLLSGAVWPALHYGRRLAERGRTRAGLVLMSTLLWILAVLVSARGPLALALALPVAVLPMPVAILLLSRRELGALATASLVACTLCAGAASLGPLFPSTLTEEQLGRLVAALVPLVLGMVLLGLWFVGVRVRGILAESREANRALAESERALEQKVETRTKELARRVEEISDINEVSRTVNSTLDLDRVIETINLGLRKIFSFDQMGVLLLDETGERLRIDRQAGEGFAPELLDLLRGSGVPLAEEESALVIAVRERRTVYVPTIDSATMDSLSPTDRIIFDANPTKSVLLCPLEIQGQSIGCIFFTSRHQPFALENADIETIQRYVTTLGTAIQNARLFADAERRSAELADINELARAVNTTLDLDRVMEVAMGGLRRVFAFDQTALIVVDRDHEVVRAMRPTGPGFTPEMIERFDRVEVSLDETNSAFVTSVSRLRPVYVPDILPEVVDGMSPSDRDLYSWDPLRSLLLVPLEIHGEVIGSIFFGNATQALDLSPGEIERIQRYATPVATALQNARLFDEAKRSADEIADISEVARIVNATLDRGRVMEAVHDSLQRVFEFDQIALALLDGDGEQLVVQQPSGSGFTSALIRRVEATRIPMTEERSAFVATVRNRRTLLLASISPEVVELMSPTDRSFYDLNPPRSLLICPLSLANEVIGLIYFGNTRGELNLGKEDIERIERYVTPLATAIQNARLFAEMEVARAAAQEANQTKSVFLANMSHELRTPLNAIIGYSEMLQEEARDDGNESYVPDLDKIQISGRYLLELINGVLDLAKIESGKMEVYLEDFEVAELVKGVEGTVLPLVRKNGNQLELEGLGALGVMHSDVTKLRQMLFNLLSNACKFTSDGTIRLETERIREDGLDWLRFRVTDSGIGMNEQQLGEVFEEFSQADASTTREYGGTGLGLPITRKFCEMLGGTIEATSEPGQGSTFEIRLPARSPSPVPSEVALEPAAEGSSPLFVSDRDVTVLVIDDDASALDLIGRYLAGEGYGVLTATDGAEGLRLARERRPNLITLDVLMPRVDGWSVLQQLKADPQLAGIPVILLSMTDDRSLGFALGASEYLTKPIDRERLGAVLRKYEGGDPAAPALVVDDEPNARDVLCRALKRAGWPVVEAENGRVALDRVAENVPRLILLDLMMPVMDGFEFVAELRQHEAWREIPILVITAKEITSADRARLEGNVARIFQKGAFGRDDLLREVRSLIGTLSLSSETTST